MPEDLETLVQFDDVSTQFGDVWALRDVSFGLRKSETRIVFGAAGSGKTTLLKAAIGLIQPDSGKIRLFGEEVTNRSEHALFGLRAKAGMLFQESALFDSLTVRENVEYPLRNQQSENPLSEEEIERRAREALRFVELEYTLDKLPSELSGGMRRRVGIARAIVTEPPLVLYDSPTAGLDPITANTIMALIAKERDVRQTASLIVTHRFQDGELMANFRYDAGAEELMPVPEAERDDPERTATKFFVMKEGEIVFSGTREQLDQATDPYVRRFAKH
ncbi:MAG TPA: ATP-binding cassette domain-containing protein [Bryobacteraceae bacterium]|jgi:ABC-type transport system involved in resistance to organic solvents, ATPase component|nr:ATP-binding cassette domain-containing protein [Bryobacteraceae bacterium]